MKNIVIYVHGKGGSAEESEHYEHLFPKAEVIGLIIKRGHRGKQKKNFANFSLNNRNVVTGSHWWQTVSARFFL